VSDTPDTAGTASSSPEENSDDDAPLISRVIAEDSQVMYDPKHLAQAYEDEIFGWMDDAAEFELHTQTHSYAPSSIREFQRIWNI
jgi:hypothetical protein